MKFHFKSLKTNHFTLEHTKAISPKVNVSGVNLFSEDIELLAVFAQNRRNNGEKNVSVESIVSEIVHNWLLEQEFLKIGTIILSNGDGKQLAEFPDTDEGLRQAGAFAKKLYEKDKEKFDVVGDFSLIEIHSNGMRTPHMTKFAANEKSKGQAK